MKTLTLLRHAKSSWDDRTARDFDRPLNARGRRAARTIGREMRRLELRFDEVLASPAIRVVETLRDVEDGFDSALGARFDRRIYLASTETLLDLVQSAGEGATSLLLVGHNPGLESIAMLLSGAGELRDELGLKYPTASLAEIRLPVGRWAEVGEGTGTLSRFIRPRDLDPELGPDEES